MVVTFPLQLNSFFTLFFLLEFFLALSFRKKRREVPVIALTTCLVWVLFCYWKWKFISILYWLALEFWPPLDPLFSLFCRPVWLYFHHSTILHRLQAATLQGSCPAIAFVWWYWWANPNPFNDYQGQLLRLKDYYYYLFFHGFSNQPLGGFRAPSIRSECYHPYIHLFRTPIKMATW
jgi:hypothetical protein